MSLGIVYEITSYCNLKCGFCYNSWDHKAGAVAPLSLTRVRRLLSRVLVESQAKWLAFTGGEPLLHPHLREIIRYCRVQSPLLKLGVATNATLLDKKTCIDLKQAGLDYIEIPLLATEEQLYSRMTGVPHLTEVREALSFVKQQGLALTVSIMLSSINLQDLATIIDMAFAFGADVITINRFTPTGRGKKNSKLYTLSTSQLEQTLVLANDKSRELGLVIVVSLPIRDCAISHSDYPSLTFAPCVCGWDKWVIDPQGNLRTCEQNEEVLGNLVEHSFKELSQGKAAQKFLVGNHFDYCEDKDCYAGCRGGCRFE